MKRKNPYKQGLYTPQNNTKYNGTRPIVYRSGLELSFFRWCDRNQNVIEWGSESVVLPFISPKDGRIHRYFVDGVLKLQTTNGIKKFLVEVKPKAQTTPPSTKYRKKKSTL